MVKGQIFSQFMYGGESTYGTAATRDTVLSRVQTFDPSETNSMIYERGLGEGVNVVKSYYGPYNCGGSINFNVNDFDFLKHFVGPKTGDGAAEGSAYTLTEATSVEANNTSLQPFSFEAANITESTDDVQLFDGCVGNDFSLSGTVDSILTCDANFFGRKTYRTTSATNYTASTVSSFVMINGTWKWGSTPSEMSGVRSFTLNYTNGFSPDNFRSIESRFINIPVLQGARGYSGAVTVAASQSLASTIYTSFYGQTPSDGPEDGSSGIEPTADLEFKIEFISGSKYAIIWLDQCSIDNISEPVAIGNGVMLMTFNFTAKYGKGNAPIRWWSV